MCSLAPTRHETLSKELAPSGNRYLSAITQNTLQAQTAEFTIKKEFFDNRAITEVLFNQNTPLVSLFKDYLIGDDICEFFNSFNSHRQSEMAIS